MDRFALKDSDIKVSLTSWKDSPRIDIRTFDNGYATKKGVSLTLQRWYTLMNNKKGVDEALRKSEKDFKTHLGGNVYAEAFPATERNRPSVDIRQWFLPENGNGLKATFRGVRLGLQQWDQLKAMEDKVTAHFPELKDFVPCYDRGDHYNQLGFLSCAECTPNPDCDW